METSYFQLTVFPAVRCKYVNCINLNDLTSSLASLNNRRGFWVKNKLSFMHERRKSDPERILSRPVKRCSWGLREWCKSASNDRQTWIWNRLGVTIFQDGLNQLGRKECLKTIWQPKVPRRNNVCILIHEPDRHNVHSHVGGHERNDLFARIRPGAANGKLFQLYK